MVHGSVCGAVSLGTYRPCPSCDNWGTSSPDNNGVCTGCGGSGEVWDAPFGILPPPYRPDTPELEPHTGGFSSVDEDW